MREWVNVGMGECGNVRMGECGNVRMGEWVNVGMGEWVNWWGELVSSPKVLVSSFLGSCL